MRPGPATQHPPESVQRSVNILDARIGVLRAGYRGSIPDWPATLIEPVEREMARWVELWGGPRAEVWVRTAQEHAVAALVRLEQRCDQAPVSGHCVAELRQLRRELGLTPDAAGSVEADV